MKKWKIIRCPYVLEHETAVTPLPRQLPSESQFAVKVTVLPVKLLLQLVSCLQVK